MLWPWPAVTLVFNYLLFLTSGLQGSFTLLYATNFGTFAVLFPQICLQTCSFLFLGF